MSSLKIVCTDQVPVTAPLNHAHIVAVGVDTDNDGYSDVKHTKEQVIRNINARADTYYTIGSHTGKLAYVEVAKCQHCSVQIIKTQPDNTLDNNLDHIRRCHWQ